MNSSGSFMNGKRLAFASLHTLPMTQSLQKAAFFHHFK